MSDRRQLARDFEANLVEAQAGELLEHELAHLREELDAMAAKGTLTAKLKLLSLGRTCSAA